MKQSFRPITGWFIVVLAVLAAELPAQTIGARPVESSATPAVVRTFPGALPALPTAFIWKPLQVEVTFLAPWSGRFESATGIFADPCCLPGGLPPLPATGQITFWINGDSQNTIQFPATSLQKLRAIGAITLGGGISLLGVDYGTGGGAPQPFPALFFIPAVPGRVIYSDSGATDPGVLFRLNQAQPPAPGNPDPIPLNALTTDHLRLEGPLPGGVPPTGWHQYFAYETSASGSFNRNAGIYMEWPVAVTTPPSAIPAPVVLSLERQAGNTLFALGAQLALVRVFETAAADAKAPGARWSNLSNGRQVLQVIISEPHIAIRLDPAPYDEIIQIFSATSGTGQSLPTLVFNLQNNYLGVLNGIQLLPGLTAGSIFLAGTNTGFAVGNGYLNATPGPPAGGNPDTFTTNAINLIAAINASLPDGIKPAAQIQLDLLRGFVPAPSAPQASEAWRQWYRGMHTALHDYARLLATPGLFPSAGQRGGADAEAARQAGDAAYTRGDLAAALDAYQRALQLNSASTGALSGRANVYAYSGEYARAIEDLRVLKAQLARENTSPAANVQNLLAELLILTNRLPEADQELQSLERSQPAALAGLLRGEYFLKQGNAGQARPYFGYAASQDPGLAKTCYDLAGQLIDRRLLDWAILRLAAVEWLNPNFYQVHFAKGKALAAAGYKAEAIIAYQRYLQFDASSQWAEQARQAIALLQR